MRKVFGDKSRPSKNHVLTMHSLMQTQNVQNLNKKEEMKGPGKNEVHAMVS